jgi:hypothetical protein
VHPYLLPLAVVASGLVAGVLLWSAVCGVPLLLKLSPEQYVLTHRFWGNRFEPFQPICVAVTALADGVLAFTLASRAGQVVCGVAAACALAVIAVSATKAVPMKRWVMSLRPDDLPSDWDERDPRRSWSAWNLVRTVLAVVALVANAVAVGLLL